MERITKLAIEADQLGYALVRKEELQSIERVIDDALTGMKGIMKVQDSTNALLIELMLELSDETSESAVFVRNALQKHIGGSPL